MGNSLLIVLMRFLRWSSGTTRWAARGNSLQHSTNTNVFINVRPVDALAIADDLEILALFWRGIRESPGPCQRHADGSTIGELRANPVAGNFQRNDQRIAYFLHPMPHDY